MLNVMRRHATGWVVKVLFGILIASFAIWGIGDVLRRPSLRGGALATVAGEQITQREVMREFDNRFQQLQQRLGGGVSRGQAVSFGLMNQALDVTIARALVDAQARDLKLTISDAELAATVRGNPLFQGEKGFERERFDLYLRSLGVNEQGYLALLRDDMIRSRLIDSMTGPVSAPLDLADRLLAYRDEQRRGRALVVLAADIKVDDPDDATLKAYVEANAKAYEAPEYRSVTLVLFGPQDLAGEITVDEAAVKAEYEQRQAEFRTPEMRSFDQLVAQDEATIKEAATMALAGQGFEGIAAELKARGVERTQLGPVAKGALPDVLDKAVFATPAGATAEPVQSPFGWHLIHVTEVKPEATRPFEEVRDQLTRELQLQKASEQLPALATRLDDEVAAGTPLDQAADKLGLKALHLDALDRRGRDMKGGPADGDGLTPEILDGIFAAAKGEPSLMSQTKDGRSYVFRVDSIAPAHAKTLDEVRAEAGTAWKKERQAQQATARAEELRARIADAASFESVAAAEQGVIKHDVGPLRRDDQGAAADLTPDTIKALFETPAGSVVPHAVPALDGSAVLLVDEVIKAAPEQAAVDKLRQGLTDDLRGDVLQQYEAALRQRYTVSIDEQQLAQMMQAQVQPSQQEP